MRWIVRSCLQSFTITPSPTGEKTRSNSAVDVPLIDQHILWWCK